MGFDGLLDLGRVHVLAPRDDDVVSTAEHVQAAGVVEISEIAGLERAIPVGLASAIPADGDITYINIENPGG